MEIQVENAIEIAWNPSSNQNLKSQALEFISQLRSELQGWQICLTLVARNPRPSEIVRHVALDILNDAIHTGHLDAQSLAFLRDSLMIYIRKIYAASDGGSNDNPRPDSTNIQNKLAQTLTHIFVPLYTTDWASFFEDILSLTVTNGSTTRDNVTGIIFYLRVLNAVHDEIADVLVPRAPAEQQRDNALKDLVRERDAKMITSSWQEILVQWRTTDFSVVEQCLASIKRWVAWTDISLIVNDSFLNILFDLVAPPKAEQADPTSVATETFIEIIGKKMSADDKLELIDILKIKVIVNELISSRALQDLRSTPEYDTDLAELVAKLVNNTVSDIVKAIESVQDGTTVSIRGSSQLNGFFPYVLRFFSDEYDEICSTVIPCMTDLLVLFRKKSKSKSLFYSENSAMLPAMLNAVILKMKYDETSSWGNEDAQTDEAEFQELRKRLHVLQQAIAAVDNILYIDAISNVVVGTLDKTQSEGGRLDWREVDLALHEMYLFGELGLKSGGLYSKMKPVSPAAERLIGMMFKLIDSDIASYPHPAIQLHYMEICVRYYTFFEANTQFIAPVLERFVHFVHHDHIKVKSRSWYLFHRFVKHVRQHIGNIAQNVIHALGDLLSIKAELPEETSDDEDLSTDENDQNANARFTSQLYLYEAIGAICSAHAVPLESQVLYVRSVISPLFSDLEAHLGQAKAGDERAILQVHHLIMAFGTLAKGFSEWAPGSMSLAASDPTKAASEEFNSSAEVVLLALETLNFSFDVRTAARFAFSRFVGVLGCRILAQLPRWINGLLSPTSNKEEMALFLRLLDQVIYGFKSEIFDILNTILAPFLQRVFSGIGEVATGTDDEIQVAELKHEYLNFLLAILNHNLQGVLVSEANQPGFDGVISTIEHFAKDITDLPTARLAFAVFTRMVMTWGGPDLQSQPPGQGNGAITESTPQVTLPGFDQFMMTRFSPLCWAIPSNPNFSSKDAQGRLVLGEAASLQRAIYAKTGQGYLTWLKDVELRGMGMDEGNVAEYLHALCTLDSKGFQQYFRALVQKNRGI